MSDFVNHKIRLHSVLLPLFKPDWASKIKHTPRASTRSFAWYFSSPHVLTSLKWTSLQPTETHKKVMIYLPVSDLSILAWYRENRDGIGALPMYAAKIKILTSWRWETSSHPTYHANVIKLKIWEIIWTGRCPHLSGLTLLPGVPHLHVNRPVLTVSLYLLPRATATIIKTFL